MLKATARFGSIFVAASGFAHLGMSWLALPRGGLMEDDSWFYAQIAYQWPRLGFVTFDGLHPTSGLHAAWGAMLAALAWIISWLSDDKLLHAAILSGAYLTLLWAVAERIAMRSVRPLPWAFASFVFMLLGALLMETAALALVLVLLLERLVRDDFRDDPSSRLGSVGLAALAVLCRVDALLILLPWLALSKSSPQRMALIQGMLVGVLLHLGSMLLVFGELTSVSSRIKAGLAFGAGDIFPESNRSGLLVRAVLWLALWSWAGRNAWLAGGSRRWTLLGALAGSFAFTAIHGAFSDIRSWYFVPGYAVATAVIAHTSRTPAMADQRLQALLRGGAVGVAVLLLGYKASVALSTEKAQDSTWKFVQEVQARVPQQERIYEIDASGFSGYWSERHVINGDGLVNDSHYADRLLARNLAGYLDEADVCWIIRTGRVTPKNKQLLLDYRGLLVRESEAQIVFPRGKKRGKQTELWRLDRCRKNGRSKPPASFRSDSSDARRL